MSAEDLCNYETVAIKLALHAGEMMKSASGRLSSVEQKSSFADLVTEADKAVENYVFGELRKIFPTHKCIGEETSNESGQLTDAPTWIVDPIDGTMNFVHTFPFSCISIGLTINKEPVLGVVYSPFWDKLFTAIKGQGAKCNGKPIQVRKTANSLKEALVVAEFGSDRSEEKRNAVYKNMEAIGWTCHGIRMLGAAAMNICSVAAGYADAYYEFGLHSWDMCGSVVIAREAGGYVCDTKGGPFDLLSRRLIVASTEKIALELGQALPIHLELERD